MSLLLVVTLLLVNIVALLLVVVIDWLRLINLYKGTWEIYVDVEYIYMSS